MANSLAVWFHRFLIRYAYYYKFFEAFGIQQFKFAGRQADKSDTKENQELQIRPLRYSFRLEFLDTFTERQLTDLTLNFKIKRDIQTVELDLCLLYTSLIFHISLPKGIKLVNGATLMKDVTFDFISQITPYYSTIDMVRLAAGPTLKKLSDITIACQIYRSSNEADLITAARVPLSGLQHTRLIGLSLIHI